jgi:hypothetical protein
MEESKMGSERGVEMMSIIKRFRNWNRETRRGMGGESNKSFVFILVGPQGFANGIAKVGVVPAVDLQAWR